tara:strand:- start:3385 stop:3744 length:360 start_codon:yes stop_codon:yes gene_type:complete
MRRRVAYCQQFERFWARADPSLGAKGSKKEAYAAWASMVESQEDAAFIIQAYDAQAQAKRELKGKGLFFAPFPNLCRYIKHERFDDGIDQQQSTGTKDDRRKEEYRAYLEHARANWGDT